MTVVTVEVDFWSIYPTIVDSQVLARIALSSEGINQQLSQQTRTRIQSYAVIENNILNFVHPANHQFPGRWLFCVPLVGQ